MAPIGGKPARTALRVTAGPAVGKLILVDEELRVGRSEHGEGALGGDASLSDKHAVVMRDHAGEWMVHDLGSGNGTFLNGEPLSAIEPLHRGDTLRLGDTRMLVVEGPPRAPAARTVPRAAPPTFAPPQQPPAAAPQPGTETLPPPIPATPPRSASRIAPYRTRWIAAVIDGVIATAIVTAVIVALGAATFSGLLAVALVLCWDFLFESLRGQTIGKRAMKIRVVRRDGTRLRPQHVAARNVLRLIDGLPGVPLVGLLSIILSGPERRQRLGDLAAGTVVVKSERGMSKLPPAARDRFVLAAYPVLWLTPVIAWALMTPGATAKACTNAMFSAHPPEQTCMVALPDDGGRALLTAVNAGHTLHWRGYDVRLLAIRSRSVRRSRGVFTVVGLKLAVRNATGRPARFDHRAVRMLLNVPLGGGEVRSAIDLPSKLRLGGFRPVAQQRAIARGRTRVAWARFGVPSGAVAQLNVTLASISFFPAASPPGELPSVGNIRLWTPATPQGAAAVHVRN